MPQFTPALLDPQIADDLRRRALAAAENAYAPYSRFRVGAAIALAGPHTGTIVIGCNVENASYRLTTCAEQTAIAAAVAQFGPSIQVAAVAVANLNQAASVPCGACRQTLLEFAPEPAGVTIFYPGENGAEASTSLADLLPAAFRLHPDKR